VEDALQNPLQDVLIMYNHHSNEIYWPAGGIFTLSTFKPGEGYQANFINPVTVTFPDYDMNPEVTKSGDPVKEETCPWNISKTGDVHLISLASKALQELDGFSHLGAFTKVGHCIGYANISNKGQNILLTLYGDDAYTGFKDGAENGEMISFRAYDEATGLETVLDPSYNDGFPNRDGLFAAGGLSAISSFKASSTGIGDSGLLSQIRIYPNPAKDELNLVFEDLDISSDTRIELMNSVGSVVLENDILQKQTRLDIQHIQPGMYVLKIFREGKYDFRKIVVQ